MGDKETPPAINFTSQWQPALPRTVHDKPSGLGRKRRPLQRAIPRGG